jgi:hypothetical protein
LPEQQILNVSNQVDDEQVSTTVFPSTVEWINAPRAAYCANQGLTGIRNWLPAQSTSYHTILEDQSRWSSVTAAAETCLSPASRRRTLERRRRGATGGD